MGEVGSKTIDLLTLCAETNLDSLAEQVVSQEPLLNANHKPQIRKYLDRLAEKMICDKRQQFYLFKMLRAHILPLTNCAFNKGGDKFITGSYDRTCKIWDTNNGCLLYTSPSPRDS
eukprot:TRINITY_DN11281_c0_g1_i2.p1 TRINITY_DN11281_c0_g1~~TRINITY_DN11281_c0_g1_i2.p1  ORF type:complete len:116 (-),score=37.72 TRINITY_DN11281_c0_g1_i2:149-496(-)